MNKILTFTLSSLLCTSLPSSCAFCDEPQQAEHVSVAQRPMSDESRVKMKEQREENPADLPQEAPKENSSRLAQKQNARASQMNPKKEFFFNNTSATAHHWLVSATYDGTILELEDGSNWKLSPSYSVLQWRVGDPIVITPNHSWFSEYNYYIVNRFTGSYVAADLIVGPIAFGPYTHWVIGMDQTNGHVYLENGSTWSVAANDNFIFKDWAINDTIIIGSNDSWFSNYDSILINVNMNNYIRAKKY